MDTGAKRSRVGKRLLAAALLAVGLWVVACQTVEKVLPYAVVAGGAILSVVALNFVSDCSGGDTWYTSCDASGEMTSGYPEQVLLMIGTLTTVAGAAADSFVEDREKKRELAKLEAAESQVDTEYAKLQNNQPAGQSWANAYATPAGGPAEPARWANASPVPSQGSYGGPQYASGPPPGAGAPPPHAGPGAGPPGGGDEGAGHQGQGQGQGQGPWGDRYAGGAASRSSTQALGLDVALLKRVAEADGAERMVAFADGEVLFDGRGESTEDRFRVFASPSEDAYLYVIAIDALGRVQPLFPRRYPDQSNPIRAGERILLPDDRSWYGLDEYTGIQHIYVYGSREPRAELEKQLTLFASAPPPAPRGTVHYVSETTVLNSRGIQGRGLTGVVPGDVVRLPGAAALEFQPTRVLATSVEQDVVATRTFEHR